jgi:hypothetical protein
MRDLRVESLKELKNPMVKVAFDTRRINQYTETNPRRNLQNYHRSDPFITKDAAEKIKTLFKLKTAVDLIKESFTGDPDWHDSYCRVLSAALDRTLRLEQKDMDFAQPQFNYLEELLYLRYRLRDEDIVKLNEKELRDIILDRDERLLHKQIFAKYNNGGLQKTNELNNQTIVKGPDNLIDKLFSDVKASKDNPNVKRSVTITIDDQIVNPVQEEKKD